MDSLLSHQLPGHVAIIMDGNGRWAKQQGKPRHFGHRVGADITRKIIEESGRIGVSVLTLFAFSSENWSRPKSEISFLMDLFLRSLDREIRTLEKKNVCFRVIGDRSNLPAGLVDKIVDAEKRTDANDGLILQLAVSYGGRWDILQAVRQIASQVAKGECSVDEIDEKRFAQTLTFSDLQDVDLFIRTGGELRISNFILWQAAYAELYFTEVLWPDFTPDEFHKALKDYARRQRRFGRTGEQLGDS